ncbi:hypothetical protein [Hymenobacter cheonanensis]|uniref:hypothetical protein n=1 Tax=Hymenobacter sp. CA2-7 TaxID=3063993 RepID=UPI00271230B2|nr:hypothetical protein [Hymenobacter sp. CA2-7]MDO7885334.1 hypothetical protein [Hymenobacter sp. CA2-7]
MFRFCRIIEDRGRQYLVRAANDTALIGFGRQTGPATALTLDTWLTAADGWDWKNLRLTMMMPGHVEMLQALECFTTQHARDAGHLMLARQADQLTKEEFEESHYTLVLSVWAAVIRRYGSFG